MLCTTQKVNFIPRLYLKYLNKFHGWVSHSKKRKRVYVIYMSQTVFKVQPSRSSSFSPSDFYLFERLQTPAYSSPIENEEMFYRCILYASRTIRKCCGTFEIVRPTLIRRALACTDLSGRYLERLLWIVTCWTIRTQQLLNLEHVFQTSVSNRISRS